MELLNMFRVNNLKFSYKKGENILDGIDFTLYEDKIYILLGKKRCWENDALKMLMWDV